MCLVQCVLHYDLCPENSLQVRYISEKHKKLISVSYVKLYHSVKMYHMIAFMHIQDFDVFFLSSEQAKTEKFWEYISWKHVQRTFHKKKM